MGRYKSYLTGVQNEGGGEGRGHFWTMSKRKTLFVMASLRSETKNDKPVKRVLRESVFSEMNFFALLSLTFKFDILFQYIKTCIPSKIPRGGGRWRAWGWIELWVSIFLLI